MGDRHPDEFDAVQGKLATALEANRQGSTTDHVLIALPSYSVNESMMSHYADRIPALEHRYLNAILIATRIPACEVLFISSRAPRPEVLDYYTSVMGDHADRELRFRAIEVDDGTVRSVAAKLLDSPERLAEIRALVGDRPALIEAWNVTTYEEHLAIALGIPINGTRPELRSLGFKGVGRRLFREAGVPVPEGVEDVRTVDDVVAAVRVIREHRPGLAGIVIKHDDSGAGDGNQVLDVRPMAAAPDPDAWLLARLAELPAWYLEDLAKGGVVEERVDGIRFSSPSCQVDIRPDGSVQVLATHEQVLGGPGNQVYLGCRFPADPAYAPVLARYAQAIGERLAAEGACGRAAIDFVAAQREDGSWDVYAIEVNLRKGGTTHPYIVLRSLLPGRYDAEHGRWVAALDGSARCYSATDNLVHERWKGLPPSTVIEAVGAAGLTFNHRTHTGAVMHMLSGLAIDGRMGLTAVGRTPEEAQAIHEGVARVLDGLADTRDGAGAPAG